jgi:hypothetical protein
LEGAAARLSGVIGALHDRELRAERRALLSPTSTRPATHRAAAVCISGLKRVEALMRTRCC